LYFRELQRQLKAKDEKLIAIQKELYEMKLKAVETLKKDLEFKITELSRNT
jgi:hypothetical protein